jgi:ethanolamine permease
VPLFDAATASKSAALQIALFVGTLFAAIASANGCINDASRA